MNNKLIESYPEEYKEILEAAIEFIDHRIQRGIIKEPFDKKMYLDEVVKGYKELKKSKEQK